MVSVDALAFLPEPGSVQHVGVRVNGMLLGEWIYNSAAPSGIRTVAVPASIIKDGNLTLDLSLPDASSPNDHKLSPDGRKWADFM